MKMDEHARAWAHELVTSILGSAALPPEQRSSLHWEIVSHLHEGAERHVEARGGTSITLADVQVVVEELGGREGLARAFQLQDRIVATPRAGFGKRLGAFVIDAALGFFFIGMFMGFFGFLFGAFGGPFWGFFGALVPVASFGLWYGYNVVTEMKYGATVGKMALKVKTVMTDGRPVTTEAALIRNIAKAFPPLLVIDALLYLLAFQKDDQRASDRLANTIVIDTTRTAWSSPGPSVPAPSAPAPSAPSTVPEFRHQE